MRTPDAAALAVLAHAIYRKSSRSSATGSCVMVGSAGGWVGIQDSKERPDSTRLTTLAIPHQQWATFLHAVKAGQLNL
jgi:hypothetical protein